VTLTVDAFKLDEDGGFVWLPLQSDLAGFNSARHNFYGSKAARDAGLTLLPSLREIVPLTVIGPDLELLRREVQILRTLVKTDQAEYWNFRLDNILLAIEEAEKHGPSSGGYFG